MPERAVDTFVGFDSAWTDNPKAPGAIAAVSVQDGSVVGWHPPRLVSFDGALAFIKEVRSSDGVTLVALDQPTIVANAVGMRPVERAAASLVSWLGGGVQPSNAGRVGMFCKDSPVWRFLSALGAKEDPEAARVAWDGLFLIEVFPAIALASLSPDFFGRLAAPRYNPGRKTFKLADWVRVAGAAAAEAEALGCAALADWCRQAGALPHPMKADQDKLDAALCTSVAVRWRQRPREHSLLLGDLSSGYMVMPISPAVHSRLSEIAGRVGVAVDGGSMACWEREIGAGRFEAIPCPFRWGQSALFAHLLDGYRLLGSEALAALANEKAAQAEAGEGWHGTAQELWACLFFEHRRWRHAGFAPPDKEKAVLDDLCGILRERLLALDSTQRADLLKHLSLDVLGDA